MNKHIRIVGYMYFIYSLVSLLIIILMFSNLLVFRWVPVPSQELPVHAPVHEVFDSTPFLWSFISVLGLISSIGLLKGYSWSVMALIFIGIIHALTVIIPPGFPLGTAMGIYALWVLIGHRFKSHHREHNPTTVS